MTLAGHKERFIDRTTCLRSQENDLKPQKHKTTIPKKEDDINAKLRRQLLKPSKVALLTRFSYPLLVAMEIKCKSSPVKNAVELSPPEIFSPGKFTLFLEK